MGSMPAGSGGPTTIVVPASSIPPSAPPPPPSRRNRVPVSREETWVERADRTKVTVPSWWPTINLTLALSVTALTFLTFLAGETDPCPKELSAAGCRLLREAVNRGEDLSKLNRGHGHGRGAGAAAAGGGVIAAASGSATSELQRDVLIGASAHAAASRHAHPADAAVSQHVSSALHVVNPNVDDMIHEASASAEYARRHIATDKARKGVWRYEALAWLRDSVPTILGSRGRKRGQQAMTGLMQPDSCQPMVFPATPATGADLVDASSPVEGHALRLFDDFTVCADREPVVQRDALRRWAAPSPALSVGPRAGVDRALDVSPAAIVAGLLAPKTHDGPGAIDALQSRLQASVSPAAAPPPIVVVAPGTPEATVGLLFAVSRRTQLGTRALLAEQFAMRAQEHRAGTGTNVAGVAAYLATVPVPLPALIIAEPDPAVHRGIVRMMTHHTTSVITAAVAPAGGGVPSSSAVPPPPPNVGLEPNLMMRGLAPVPPSETGASTAAPLLGASRYIRMLRASIRGGKSAKLRVVTASKSSESTASTSNYPRGTVSTGGTAYCWAWQDDDAHQHACDPCCKEVAQRAGHVAVPVSSVESLVAETLPTAARDALKGSDGKHRSPVVVVADSAQLAAPLRSVAPALRVGAGETQARNLGAAVEYVESGALASSSGPNMDRAAVVVLHPLRFTADEWDALPSRLRRHAEALARATAAVLECAASNGLIQTRWATREPDAAEKAPSCLERVAPAGPDPAFACLDPHGDSDLASPLLKWLLQRDAATTTTTAAAANSADGRAPPLPPPWCAVVVTATSEVLAGTMEALADATGAADAVARLYPGEGTPLVDGTSLRKAAAMRDVRSLQRPPPPADPADAVGFVVQMSCLAVALAVGLALLRGICRNFADKKPKNPARQA